MRPTTPTRNLPEKTCLEVPKGTVHPKPRKRKNANTSTQAGIRNVGLEPDQVKKVAKKRLKLPYNIDDWQAHTIHAIWSGHDAMVCAVHWMSFFSWGSDSVMTTLVCLPEASIWV
ncbi:hypothetical protein M422DRAFT_259190 [Sphaerobolus stellatus SS14]|uniref:Uncharacterized protein n=1 Tax=Sphaerobolus stellatus (strain SS14) TaxID=990650 RepID=A0A0C9U5L6_SPHS4|nr:hypothetical protein M422DRAFT_259190 [Sphaerobolus stellatus SS14]